MSKQDVHSEGDKKDKKRKKCGGSTIGGDIPSSEGVSLEQRRTLTGGRRLGRGWKSSPGFGTALRALSGWKSSQECDDGGVLGPGSSPEQSDSHERDQGRGGDDDQQRDGGGEDGDEVPRYDKVGEHIHSDGISETEYGAREVGGADGQGDGHHEEAPGVNDDHVQQHFSQVNSRKPKPMFFKRKRGIVPDGLVQMRLSNFMKIFPYLQPSGAVTMGGGLTNEGGAAHQRILSANHRPDISSFGKKRKVDQDHFARKRWRESAEPGVTNGH